MLNVVFKSRFKKDLKKLKSSNRDEEQLLTVIDLLASQQPLDPTFRDHVLVGNYAGCRECHIRTDWLLNYQTTQTELLLVRTGSLSELFC
ncbi:MAG: type II toxin-antitoxin system YafQ family toxin [Opitutales bacterium]|nr:type II toxin-antitoxin system YafQ family toxin [Opitutales bacterium]MCH8540153.1 type II toxin-antitoxin system YafQ family toxin [Opitutales bacterium]